MQPSDPTHLLGVAGRPKPGLQGPRALVVFLFAGLLTALGDAVTGLILLDNSWLQSLIAVALGVIFTQFAFIGHEAPHR
jgi:fatty acid desaturase